MSNASMPVEVPALTADKLVRNTEQSGCRRCLTGWVMATFKNKNVQRRIYAALAANIKKKLKGDQLKEFNQITTGYDWLGSIETTANQSRCVYFNDEWAKKLSQVANVWNMTMHDLGYGVAKFSAKKTKLIKQTKKKAAKKK